MVYFDNILEFLGAAQFEAFSLRKVFQRFTASAADWLSVPHAASIILKTLLRFNLCFGTTTRDLASLFKLNGTKVGDGSSEDCKSSILIQNPKNPFKQLDLGDELPFVELAMGYNHVLQVNFQQKFLKF